MEHAVFTRRIDGKLRTGEDLLNVAAGCKKTSDPGSPLKSSFLEK